MWTKSNLECHVRCQNSIWIDWEWVVGFYIKPELQKCFDCYGRCVYVCKCVKRLALPAYVGCVRLGWIPMAVCVCVCIYSRLDALSGGGRLMNTKHTANSSWILFEFVGMCLCSLVRLCVCGCAHISIPITLLSLILGDPLWLYVFYRLEMQYQYHVLRTCRSDFSDIRLKTSNERTSSNSFWSSTLYFEACF